MYGKIFTSTKNQENSSQNSKFNHASKSMMKTCLNALTVGDYEHPSLNIEDFEVGSNFGVQSFFN